MRALLIWKLKRRNRFITLCIGILIVVVVVVFFVDLLEALFFIRISILELFSLICQVGRGV